MASLAGLLSGSLLQQGDRAARSVVVIVLERDRNHDIAATIPDSLDLSLFNLLWTITHLELGTEERSDETQLHLAGMGTFRSIPKLSRALDKVNTAIPVRVHAMQLRYIDHGCIELIESWTEPISAQGATMHIEMDMLHKRFHTPVSRRVV